MKDVAERLGFSSSYISQLENGTRVPSPKRLALLAKAYDVTEEDLQNRWRCLCQIAMIYLVSEALDCARYALRSIGIPSPPKIAH